MQRSLPGFEQTTFAHAGRTHPVYRGGSGPAVVLVHEMPGLIPEDVGLGRRIVNAGFTVYLPSLFGEPGAPFSPARLARSVVRVCVSREFILLADRTSPVVTWLRALAAQAHAECGGPGVGAIGMCFTGGFALAMAVEPAVLAPVLSQPALPAPVTAGRRAALGLDAADLAAVKERAGHDLRAVGLRFTADMGCPAERFQTLRRELGSAFTSIEIDSSPATRTASRHGRTPSCPSNWSTSPDTPHRAALDRVIAFLAERLRV